MTTPPRLTALLDGPAPTLPGLVDDVAERWARLGPRPRWVLAAVASVLLVLLLRPPGPGDARRVDVVVAVRDLGVGDRVTVDDVVLRGYPADLAPDGWLEDLARATEHGPLTAPVRAGTPLLVDHLTGHPLVAGLAAGRVAIAVPLAETGASPVVDAGQRVDVLAVSLSASGAVLARSALVLHRDPTHVWIDVARGEAPGIAAALGVGDVLLALLSPSG